VLTHNIEGNEARTEPKQIAHASTLAAPFAAYDTDNSILDFSHDWGSQAENSGAGAAASGESKSRASGGRLTADRKSHQVPAAAAAAKKTFNAFPATLGVHSMRGAPTDLGCTTVDVRCLAF
jgi:hypothetical protein